MVKKQKTSRKAGRTTARRAGSDLTVGFQMTGPAFKQAPARMMSAGGKSLSNKSAPRKRAATSGGGETVTLPRRDYEALVEAAEERQALRAYAAARDEEAFPADVVSAIIDGANPVRAWRKYRGLKQAELAESLGISKSHLSEVETGKGNLSVPVLSALADALEVDMEMLVPQEARR